MRIKFIFLSLSFIVMLFGSPVYAEEVSNKMSSPKVYLYFKYYSDGGMTAQSVKQELLDKYVIPTLLKNKCEVITDDKFFAKLQAKGYSDSVNAEKADIIDAYKDDGFKYLIFIDIDPARHSTVSYCAFAYMKIVDMENRKFIFNGRIFQKGGGAGTVVDKMGKDIAKILEDKVFASTPAQTQIR